MDAALVPDSTDKAAWFTPGRLLLLFSSINMMIYIDRGAPLCTAQHAAICVKLTNIRLTALRSFTYTKRRVDKGVCTGVISSNGVNGAAATVDGAGSGIQAQTLPCPVALLCCPLRSGFWRLCCSAGRLGLSSTALTPVHLLGGLWLSTFGLFRRGTLACPSFRTASCQQRLWCAPVAFNVWGTPCTLASCCPRGQVERPAWSCPNKHEQKGMRTPSVAHQTRFPN